MTTGGTSTTPTAREITAQLRRVRRGHSDITVWQALEAAYLYVFAVLVVGSMAVVAIVGAWQALSACAVDCRADRLSLSVASAVALSAVWLRGLVAVGPLTAGRATAAFLLSTPVARGPLLRSQAFALLSAGALLGAGGSGALTSLASRPSVLAVLTGAVCGLLLTGLAILGQAQAVLGRALALACDIVLVALVALVPLLLARVLDPAGIMPGWPGQLLLTAVLCLAAIAVVVRAARLLPSIPRRDLVVGGDFREGLSGAAASLDSSLVSDVLHHRRFRRLGGARRSWRGRGRGLAAMAYRELLRPLRSPWRLWLAAGLVILPYAAGRLGLPAILPITAAVAGYLAIRPLGAGLHTIEWSPGLARAFPQRPAARRRAFAVPLLVGAAIWAFAVTPALARTADVSTGPGLFDASPALSGLPVPPASLLLVLTWAALFATIASGVIRSVTRQPVRYEGLLIYTRAGALPVGFVAQVFRGPDIVAICSAALVFGLHPGPSSLLLLVPPVILAYLLAPVQRPRLRGLIQSRQERLHETHDAS